MARKWIKIEVPVGNDAIEGVSNFLFELGAVGLTEQEGGISAFFPYPSQPRLLQTLKTYLLELQQLHFDVDPSHVSIQTIPEKDWVSAWKAHFRPVFVTPQIVVKPPWEKVRAPIVIDIDPGRAFGTGSHPSTQLALRFLLRYISGTDEVLDIGTGSGILAIAAAKLGAKRVVALETDPQALENTQRNLALNKVTARVLWMAGSIERVKGEKFDLILANLNKTVLLEILQSTAELLKPCGHFILSGLLAEDVYAIRGKLVALHLHVVDKAVMNDWVSLVVSKG